ncbi:hypothetical protein HK096_011061 [Nowakowskiella sp. JEL0078]|nr:hypothetical protein HK096_011061 [Nowakowskiella sp. JEL0078]
MGFKMSVTKIVNAHVLDTTSKQQSKERNSVTSLLFARHQKNILASSGSSDGLIKYWDLRYANKSSLRAKPDPVAQTMPMPGVVRQHGISSIATDSDGTRLVALSRDSGIYEYSSHSLGSPLQVLRWPTQRCDSFYLRVTLSPDARFVACGSSDSNIYVWEFGGAPAPIILQVHEGEVSAVTWNKATEKQMASCSDDGTVRIWNMVQNSPEDDNPANKHLRSTIRDTMITDSHLISEESSHQRGSSQKSLEFLKSGSSPILNAVLANTREPLKIIPQLAQSVSSLYSSSSQTIDNLPKPNFRAITNFSSHPQEENTIQLRTPTSKLRLQARLSPRHPFRLSHENLRNIQQTTIDLTEDEDDVNRSPTKKGRSSSSSFSLVTLPISSENPFSSKRHRGKDDE